MDNKKLTAALEKKAVYGNDIDLSSYSDSDKAALKAWMTFRRQRAGA